MDTNNGFDASLALPHKASRDVHRSVDLRLLSEAQQELRRLRPLVEAAQLYGVARRKFITSTNSEDPTRLGIVNAAYAKFLRALEHSGILEPGSESLPPGYAKFVDMTAADGHWRWTGCTSHGQPRVRHQGKMQQATRIIYEAAFDVVVPESQRVYRTCLNNLCVRPDHLALADRKTFNQTVEALRKLAASSGQDE